MSVTLQNEESKSKKNKYSCLLFYFFSPPQKVILLFLENITKQVGGSSFCFEDQRLVTPSLISW